MRNLLDFQKGAMRLKMNNILGKIDQYDLSSSNHDNYYHHSLSIILNNLEQSKRIFVTETSIDFKVLFDFWKKNGIDTPADHLYSQMACLWYTDEGSETGYFIPTCIRELIQKKIVYVLLDFHNYIPNRPHLISADALYECHATCLIIYLDNRNSLQMYHFNPHGQAGSYVNNYTFCISLRRRETFPLPTGLDRFVLTHLSETMNRYINQYYTCLSPINYSITKEHNYMGPNLQAGDNTGICYVFQALLFCELIEWFDTKKEVIFFENMSGLQLKKKILEPCKSLLRNREMFNLVMRSITSIYAPLQKYVDCIEVGGGCINDSNVTMNEMRSYCSIESVIEEKGNIFIKGLLGTLIPFLTQKGIRDRVEKIVSV